MVKNLNSGSKNSADIFFLRDYLFWGVFTHHNCLGRVNTPSLMVGVTFRSAPQPLGRSCIPALFGKGVCVGGMPWPQTGVTHYHAELESLDKDRARNQRVGFCYVLCTTGIR